MPLNAEMDAKLVAINKKSQAPAEQPVTQEPVTQEVPVQTEPEVKLEAEVKSQDNEQPLVEETKTSEKPWYADEEEVKTPTKTDFDFSELGSALELGEVKTKEEFITKTSELKSKLKQLETDALSGVPEEFREVIKVTKSGADWKDYLASQLIDYTKVDPIQLFENEYFKDAEKNPRFFTDGKFDEAKVEEALDAMPEALREQYGKQLAYGKIQEQKQRQAEIRAKAEARLAEAESSLVKATKDLNEILPFENYGIKFDSQLSSDLYKGISNSRLTKKHLGGADFESLVKGGFDMKAITRTIALAEYGEKMLKHKANATKAETKREILAKTQNAQITTPGSKVNPEDPEKKVMSPKEKLMQFNAASKTRGL